MAENKIINLINTIADCVFLSILGVVGSIPVVTSPVAFIAVCHVMSKVIIKGEGTVFSEYCIWYRKNLKNGIVVFFVTAGIFLTVAVPLYLLYPSHAGRVIFQLYEISFGFLLILLIIIELRMVAVLAVTEVSLKDSLASACILLRKKVISGAALLLVFGMFVFLTILYPPIVLITPSVLAWIDLKASPIKVVQE